MNPRSKEEIFQYISKNEGLKQKLPDEKCQNLYYSNFDGNMQELVSFEESNSSIQGLY